ncbi:hypothetical protein SDRG_01646 [Saprolegnia diclina VS20]|uniref:Uncharacterized protein n=1 Tax=Saprolegnia diclina (strain VS20) TaxID=1156394 RepID=T0S8R8_SAPDV|nr:hypothetical protein SDRG_01646 [Saprolegnia diclina VS20]EQC41688.1 hypothetical protein SDRG_01646 [Saprolegnia diclina VS20]|eukprot:XP_008605402.1 hypothetical protein SDRG_01646 [Saprolegnia diclina VS20]
MALSWRLWLSKFNSFFGRFRLPKFEDRGYAAMDDDVLFDALDVQATPEMAEPTRLEQPKTEMAMYMPASNGPDIKDRVYMEQILTLTSQVGQLKASAAEFTTARVQSAAELSTLRQQLDRHESAAKHLKQMLKNISDKYTALQNEHKSTKEEADEQRTLLTSATERVVLLEGQVTAYEAQREQWVQLQAAHDDVRRELSQATAERDAWQRQVVHFEGVEAANEQLRSDAATIALEHELARKRMHHIIKELRKSLAEERARQPPSPVVISTPLAVKCIHVAEPIDSAADVVSEFALRIEGLLQANALLTERLRFSEENTRLLATDLEKKRLLLSHLTRTAMTEDMDDMHTLAKAMYTERLETANALLLALLRENAALKARAPLGPLPLADGQALHAMYRAL